MIFTLLELSLRGSLIFLLVASVDLACAKGMTASWRRIWWLIIPVAFLLPIRFSPLHPQVSLPVPSAWQKLAIPDPVSPDTAFGQIEDAPPPARASLPWLEILWLSGVAASLLGIAVPTVQGHRQWSRLRLATDPALLNLLEDSKHIAGVTAPIGLVISDQVAAPALLGWLRPRILLPTHLATASASVDLRAIFLHELAHFKSGDIPLNWLFALVRVVHWYNPLAWLAGAAWARFREEAADESAIRWMNEGTSAGYGEILIRTLKNCPGGRPPCGALAIGETLQHLKRRIIMIRHYSTKSNRGAIALIVILILTGLMALAPSLAQDDVATATQKAKDQAVAAMQPWLEGIDAGNYAPSWSEAATSFQTAITSDKWVAALTSVRTPLGKMTERKFVSAMYQDGIVGHGVTLPGQFVTAQFDSSFENLKYAVETVTFEKEADGTWRAAGYYIKPK